MTREEREASEGGDESESVDDLFREIWERESQPELRFGVRGVLGSDDRCFPAGWLRDRRILEVGAGTGLVGLSLALLGAKVTMTDLPEALPILRHNTDATFATLDGGDGNNGDGSHASDPSEACHRPTIQRLCWGDGVDAGQVAAAAADAAVDGEDCSEWQGFDLIVGADVIYNEQTFPALVSTLSDRRLCSDKTLVYLATMLRGGRHEGLLEMLNEGGFHVRALDPASANELRARVAGDGNEDATTTTTTPDKGTEGGEGGGASRRRAWAGPEWQRGVSLLQERRKIKMVPVLPADRGGDARCCRGTSGDAGTGNKAPSPRESAGKCGYPEATSGGDGPAKPAAKVGGGALERRSPNAEDDGKGGAGGGGGWGYNEVGLGKILAFVARRRGEAGDDG